MHFVLFNELVLIVFILTATVIAKEYYFSLLSVSIAHGNYSLLVPKIVIRKMNKKNYLTLIVDFK